MNLLGHRVHERGRALFVEVWQLYLIVVFPELVDGFLGHLGDLRVLSVEALNKGRTLGPPLFCSSSCLAAIAPQSMTSSSWKRDCQWPMDDGSQLSYLLTNTRYVYQRYHESGLVDPITTIPQNPFVFQVGYLYPLRTIFTVCSK